MKIVYDVEMYPESPLYDDSIIRIAYLSDSRYVLGNTPISSADYKQFAHIIETSEQYICYPVYAYVHGGTVILRRRPFSGYELPQGHAEFDSAQSGHVYVSRAAARAAWNVKRITAQVRRQIDAAIDHALETYSAYLSGDVYTIYLYDDDDDGGDGDLLDLTTVYGWSALQAELRCLRTEHPDATFSDEN